MEGEVLLNEVYKLFHACIEESIAIKWMIKVPSDSKDDIRIKVSSVRWSSSHGGVCAGISERM